MEGSPCQPRAISWRSRRSVAVRGSLEWAPGWENRMCKGKWCEGTQPVTGVDRGSRTTGIICRLEGCGQGQRWEMPVVGREYITESQHAMPAFELRSTDAGSCRNGSEAIDFCVLETSLWWRGGERWMVLGNERRREGDNCARGGRSCEHRNWGSGLEHQGTDG